MRAWIVFLLLEALLLRLYRVLPSSLRFRRSLVERPPTAQLLARHSHGVEMRAAVCPYSIGRLSLNYLLR